MRKSCRYSPFWEVTCHAEKTFKEECAAPDAGLCGVSSDIDPVCDIDVFLSPAGVFRGDKSHSG